MWQEFKKLGLLLSQRDFRGLLWLAGCVLIMGLLEVLGVFAILPFMNLVADPSQLESQSFLRWLYDTLGFTSTRQMLIWMGGGMLLLFAATSVFAVLTNWLIQHTIWSMAHRLSTRMLQQYMQLPYTFYLKTNTSSLIKKAISDISNLVSGVLLSGAQFVANIVKVTLILVLLMFVEPTLALLALAIYGGLYFAIHWLRHSYLQRLGERRQSALRARFRTFTEALGGAKTIRVEGASAMFLDRFERASREFSHIHPQFQLYNLIPRYTIELIAMGSIVGVVIFMLTANIALVDAIPVLSLFAVASYKLLPALNQAFVSAAQISHYLPVIDELYQDLKKHEGMERIDNDPQQEALTFQHDIILHDVGFQYESADTPVLQDINLSIPRGARIGIVGSTGAGKSTLVDILVGLLFPQQGSVHVDATLITPDNVRAWRKLIAYVPQDVFLFDDTIRKNIAFGVAEDQIDDALVIDAARMSHIHGFIQNELPQQYDTVVGERGVRLSGGEKQRIGLARAFYRQPQIILLDEATSALDAITQERVVSSIEQCSQELTVIVVAHRFSSIKFCDEIYFMEDGRIADMGSYQQLLSRNETFRRMVELAS